MFIQTVCILLTFGSLGSCGTINREDSYQNIKDSSDDVRENLILEEENGSIEGLLPPKPDAKDYFPNPPSVYRQSPYEIDSDGKLKLKEEQTRNDELSSEEKSAMKDIEIAFTKLMDEAKAASPDSDPSKPLVFITDDGVGEVSAVDDKSDEENVRKADETEAEDTTVPNGEPETVTTNEDMPSDEARGQEEAGLLHFFQSLWEMVQESVGYAAKLLTNLRAPAEIPSAESTSSPNDTPAVTPSTASPSSLGPVAAFEEPLAHHSLPAHELDGRRDVDSILYGRGIA